jgi:hypothetical protein
VLGVAQDLIGATLAMAGVAPMLVEQREQGRRREEEAGLGCLSTWTVGLASWAGSAQWKGKGRRAADWATSIVGPDREGYGKDFFLSIF